MGNSIVIDGVTYYSKGSNSNGGNNNNRKSNNNRSNGEVKHRTTAKAGSYVVRKTNKDSKRKKGDSVPYVRGWRPTKHGGISYFCTPFKSTKEVVSEQGRVSYNWMCTFQRQNEEKKIVGCFYYPDTRTVVIPELQLVLNPKTNYCGKFYRTK